MRGLLEHLKALALMVWTWGHSRDGITWLCHAAVAAAVAAAGWLLGWPVLGTTLALAYYWLRELKQAHERKVRLGSWTAEGVLRLDDALDANFPLWAASLVLTIALRQWLLFALVLALLVGAVVVLYSHKRG